MALVSESVAAAKVVRLAMRQRTDEVAVRLNKALGCPCVYVNRIKVVRHGSDSVIVYGKDLIVTVDS